MIRGRKKTIDSPPSDIIDDIISDLPENVVQTILIHLPLRDAARTSILSRKWRNYWVKIPELVFNDTFFQDLTRITLPKHMMTIYQVLLLHLGPIRKFEISSVELESCPHFDQLVSFLSRNGLEDFTLYIGKNPPFYELPLSFFSCLQLKHVSLQGCLIKPPPAFKGFKRLTSLEFYEIKFDGDAFVKLVSGSPLLESLTLEWSTNITYLGISAPMLKSLCIGINFSYISFTNTPLLASLSVTSNETKNLAGSKTSMMIEVFGCLSLIETLRFGCRFLKFLTFGGVPDDLPFILNHLRILEIDEVNFGERDEVAVVLCLIKSSPHLEKITVKMLIGINAVVELVDDHIELLQYPDLSFRRLREVHIRSVLGKRPELEFMKLLLAKSPNLEKMLIEPYDKEVSLEQVNLLTELTRFKRASSKAEVIFERLDEQEV